MKNILGTTENLELFNSKGKIVYRFIINSNSYSYEFTYDNNRNELTYKNSNGDSYKYTRDENGNELTYEDSRGYSYKYTRDENGKALTYENSEGVKTGFDIPEYTMEELVKKLGNFKLIKQIT